MTNKMTAQWQQLLINFSVSSPAATSIYEEIVGRYGEEGRYYHTLAHIEQVLETAEQLQQLAHDYPAIQLAVWFHDIVYDSHAADNEAQSAAYAESALTNLSIPPATVRKVGRMILATADHANPTQDADIAILLDADLAVLGSEEAAYARYCREIRREYGWVPEAAYRAGRIKVLERFLERPRIYHTPLLYERLEARARENLREEIGRLGGGW